VTRDDWHLMQQSINDLQRERRPVPMAVRGRASAYRINALRDTLMVSAMVLGAALLPIVFALMLVWGWST